MARKARIKKPVIATDNLPTRIPFTTVIVSLLIAEKPAVPEWLKGIIWFMCVVIIVASIAQMTLERHVNMFELSNWKGDKE